MEVIHTDNQEYEVLGDQYKPMLCMSDNSINNISCGAYHSMIYKNNGELYVFGGNIFGQLGTGDNSKKCNPILCMKDNSIKEISCGGFHSIIYKNNGELWVFGQNTFGQLGVDNLNDYNKPILCMKDQKIKKLAVACIIQ